LDYLDLGVSRISIGALALLGLVPVLKLVVREAADLILFIRGQVRRVRGRQSYDSSLPPRPPPTPEVPLRSRRKRACHPRIPHPKGGGGYDI